MLSATSIRHVNTRRRVDYAEPWSAKCRRGQHVFGIYDPGGIVSGAPYVLIHDMCRAQYLCHRVPIRDVE